MSDIVKRRLQFARNIVSQFFNGTGKPFAHQEKFEIIIYDLKPSNEKPNIHSGAEW